ncbi:MAG: AI-2E family transporter, partial [Clostridia bacterium]|nr:AI-2E family transporter [Clostridia bacterium]
LIVILGVDLLIRGLSTVSQGLSGHLEELSSFFQSLLNRVEDGIGRFLKRDMENSLTSLIPSLVGRFSEKLLDQMPRIIGSVASFVPKFFLSLLIFVVCTYYFSCDWAGIYQALFGRMKEEKREGLKRNAERMLQSAGRLLRAYGYLFLLTFAQLFLGLVILRVPEAFSRSILIALVDILPVLGSGTVLIPWAAVRFALGNGAGGGAILVLYGIIFLTRQFLEPKILGDSIGLHPVLSLILVICGLSLFGFFGMLLLPLLGVCLIEGMRENRAENEKKSLE